MTSSGSIASNIVAHPLALSSLPLALATLARRKGNILSWKTWAEVRHSHQQWQLYQILYISQSVTFGISTKGRHNNHTAYHTACHHQHGFVVDQPKIALPDPRLLHTRQAASKLLLQLSALGYLTAAYPWQCVPCPPLQPHPCMGNIYSLRGHTPGTLGSIFFIIRFKHSETKH